MEPVGRIVREAPSGFKRHPGIPEEHGRVLSPQPNWETAVGATQRDCEGL